MFPYSFLLLQAYSEPIFRRRRRLQGKAARGAVPQHCIQNQTLNLPWPINRSPGHLKQHARDAAADVGLAVEPLPAHNA